MIIREHNRTDKPYVDYEYQGALERIRELLLEEQEKYGSTSLLGDRLVNTISDDDLLNYGFHHFDMDFYFDMDENVPTTTKNISKEDYILWDSIENKPKEMLDVVYHYTTLVELINDGFLLGDNEEIKCVAELPLTWQKIISEAIELTK